MIIKSDVGSLIETILAGVAFSGVFFSVNPVKKTKWMDPQYYCMFRRPLTSFFVYLYPKEMMNDENITYKVAAAEEEKFLKKMEEWGVELTEANLVKE